MNRPVHVCWSFLQCAFEHARAGRGVRSVGGLWTESRRLVRITFARGVPGVCP